MTQTKNNPVREKSYAFALRIVHACRHLSDKKKEYVLSRQLLRAGTSIGANIEEALQAQSRKDFIAKLSISLKESYETDYWIRLLSDSALFTAKESLSLRSDLREIQRLLTTILKTSKGL